MKAEASSSKASVQAIEQLGKVVEQVTAQTTAQVEQFGKILEQVAAKSTAQELVKTEVMPQMYAMAPGRKGDRNAAPRYPRPYYGQGPRACWVCGEVGHFARDCPDAGWEEQGSRNGYGKAGRVRPWGGRDDRTDLQDRDGVRRRVQQNQGGRKGGWRPVSNPVQGFVGGMSPGSEEDRGEDSPNQY
ncbi:uncharacterized protein LOC132827468 [Hemiscyllium ocellatum]|uniref:uncharacterized protein LOC132827468 n=1 Tax=Hemiscyllium ocellatum TaxID=170820 RepID=UPI002966B575|nr:uncharacterized protein LOC132827468 [Hemiscyllium ocellatum]